MLFGIRPTESVRRWRRKFGDVFTIKLLPTGPFAYVADAEAARSVFSADQSQLHAGEANRMLEPVNGSNSVVVLDDERHEVARKLLLPVFRPARIAAHRGLIERVVEREMETWPLGRTFQLAPRMQDIALEVILRTTLGENALVVDRMRDLLPALLRTNTWTWMPGMSRDFGRLSPAGRLRRVSAEIDEILYAEIERRRGAGPENGAATIDYLLGARVDGRPLSEVELRDHLATLLLAGHETTSSSLAWAFERVLRHPPVVERLRAARREDGEDYLEAVVKEVLRCRPAVMDTGRILKEDRWLAGRLLPSGSHARVAISAIQQRPDLYPDPGDFRPERFLDGEVSAGDWMPFGGGARRCLGASLAMFEMKVVLSTVIDQVELRPATARDEVATFKPPRLTLSPARGCRVVLERRLAVA